MPTHLKPDDDNDNERAKYFGLSFIVVVVLIIIMIESKLMSQSRLITYVLYGTKFAVLLTHTLTLSHTRN